jgi:hypothetical protein
MVSVIYKFVFRVQKSNYTTYNFISTLSEYRLLYFLKYHNEEA